MHAPGLRFHGRGITRRGLIGLNQRPFHRLSQRKANAHRASSPSFLGLSSSSQMSGRRRKRLADRTDLRPYIRPARDCGVDLAPIPPPPAWTGIVTGLVGQDQALEPTVVKAMEAQLPRVTLQGKVIDVHLDAGLIDFASLDELAMAVDDAWHETISEYTYDVASSDDELNLPFYITSVAVNLLASREACSVEDAISAAMVKSALHLDEERKAMAENAAVADALSARMVELPDQVKRQVLNRLNREMETDCFYKRYYETDPDIVEYTISEQLEEFRRAEARREEKERLLAQFAQCASCGGKEQDGVEFSKNQKLKMQSAGHLPRCKECVEAYILRTSKKRPRAA